MDPGLDKTIGALNTALNLRQMNQNVISSNIANSDTPGYKAKVLDFERSLRDAIESSKDKEVQVTPEIYEDPNGVESLDGNTVDRATEMARMAENQLLYDSGVTLLRKKLGMLEYGITEGGGNR